MITVIAHRVGLEALDPTLQAGQMERNQSQTQGFQVGTEQDNFPTGFATYRGDDDDKDSQEAMLRPWA